MNRLQLFPVNKNIKVRECDIENEGVAPNIKIIK
jgi:hypothetical protein